MPATTGRGYPYPLDTDPIDVAGDIQSLAEAISTDVGGINSSLQSQINAILGQVNANANLLSLHSGQINALIADANERNVVTFHATNGTPMALANAQFAQYQVGSLVLTKYTYDVILTVTCGITATNGGKCEIVGGFGATPAANQERAESIHLAGETITLTHESKYVLGPGTHLVSVWGAATASGGAGGSMGRAVVSAMCVPRPLP